MSRPNVWLRECKRKPRDTEQFGVQRREKKLGHIVHLLYRLDKIGQHWTKIGKVLTVTLRWRIWKTKTTNLLEKVKKVELYVIIIESWSGLFFEGLLRIRVSPERSEPDPGKPHPDPGWWWNTEVLDDNCYSIMPAKTSKYWWQFNNCY